jgi:hypothetical protein
MAQIRNKNTEYEQFTRKVFAGLSSQKRVKTIKLQHNVKLLGNSGTRHQIDVYWEYEKDGQLHKVAIECKNYTNKVSIGRVRDFYGVLADIEGLQGIMITKAGYQSGAKKYALSKGIHLKELREPIGEECLAGRIITDFHVSMRRCLYLVDEDWAKQHGFDIKPYLCWLDMMSIEHKSLWVNASHIPIERKGDYIYNTKKEVITSHEDIEATIPGAMEEDSSHTIPFEDAYIESKYWGVVKIKEIKYEYTNETRRSIMDIDARDFIEAVLKDVESGAIEYVEKRFPR